MTEKARDGETEGRGEGRNNFYFSKRVIIACAYLEKIKKNSHEDTRRAGEVAGNLK
jgi:hypothetical protein